MKTMKKIVAILAAALMLLSVMPIAVFAAEGNVTDFDTLSTNTSYTTFTTTGGWQMVNCAVFSGGSSNSSPKFNFIDSSETTKAVCMNGKTSAVGSITSPTLSGGISKLTFSYGLPFSDTKISATITITGADGTSVSNVVENLSATKLTKYNFEWVLDTPIEGDFTIVIKNNSPSNSTSNKDRTAVWNLAWESASISSDCDHDNLLCGDTCGECETYVKEHVFANNCAATCSNCDEPNPNYADHVYSGDYDASCNVCGATREVTLPTDPVAIVDLAYTMADGDAFPAAVTLTGVISSIDEAYNSSFGNVTVTIDVLDSEGNLIEGKAIQCYRLKGEGADSIIVGDTITVSGILKNYYGKIEFDNGCTLDSYESTGCDHNYVGVETTPASCTEAGLMTYTCSLCGDSYTEDIPVADHTYVDGVCSVCGAEEINVVEYTIDFTTTDQRVSLSTSEQVWENAGLTVTNSKADSTSSVADYSNPVRFYKSSTVTIACNGMTSIVISTSGNAWDDTLTNAGVTYTKNGTVYTITFTELTDSITLTCAVQIRALNITVIAAAQGDAADCEHVWVDANCTTPKTCSVCGATDGEALGHNYVEDIIDSTCTTVGTATYECSVCGDSYDLEIALKPHNYVDGVCDVCGAKAIACAPITSADQLVSGEYILVVSSGYAPTTYSDGWVLSGLPTIADGNIVDGTGLLWTLTVDGSTVTIKDANGVYISPKGSATNGIKDGEYAWTWAFADGVFTFAGDQVYLASNATAGNDNKFRAYKATTISGQPSNYLHQFTLYAPVAEEPACEHEYFTPCDQYCMICGELTNPDAAHNVIHVEAEAATCAANGNIEYWYCDVCGAAWLNAECTQNTNLKAVVLPATGEHTYDDEYDADCNVCGDVREVEAPEIVYGDVDGDGEIGLLDASLLQQYLAEWDVELNMAAADVDCDGEVGLLDASLLEQYLAEWDVVLGPEDENKVFNDGVLGEW